MFISISDFYWENRQGNLYICFSNDDKYIDIMVMSLYKESLLSSIKNLLEKLRFNYKTLYMTPNLKNKVIEKNIEWLNKNGVS